MATTREGITIPTPCRSLVIHDSRTTHGDIDPNATNVIDDPTAQDSNAIYNINDAKDSNVMNDASAFVKFSLDSDYQASDDSGDSDRPRLVQNGEKRL